MLDISFITINYNGLNDTIELIQSINHNCTGFNYEIIVVDNGSVNDETKEIKKLFQNISTIRSEINLGFSGGNNLGIKSAKGRYIFLINNDTLIIDNSILELLKFMDSQEDAAAASPKIRFFNPEGFIQFAGYTKLSKFSIRNKLIGFNEKDESQYKIVTQTPYTHGAAMIVRRSVIEKIGLMPEIYFLYYEELDWCTAMTNQGYKLWYFPGATVIHKESQSTGQGSYLRSFYVVRNRMLYSWRNRQGITRYLSLLYLLVIAFPKGVINSILKKRFDLVLANANGVLAFINLKDKLS